MSTNKNETQQGIFARALDQEIGNPDKEDPKEIRRLEFVDAATDLFLKFGYRKTSMGDVASRAGVAKGTLYLYFQSKAELLLRALSEEKRRYSDRLAPIEDKSLTPAQRLRHFIMTLLTIGREMPLISRLIAGDKELFVALKEMPEELMEKRRNAGNELIASLLRDGVEVHGWKEEDVNERANVICGLTYFSSLLDDAHVLGGLERERFAQVMTDIIVSGAGGKFDR